MKAEIKPFNADEEFFTAERCLITEVANDPHDEKVSIARARVEPGVTTVWHKLRGMDERYIVTAGKGLVEVKGLEAVEVKPGDVVRIPADTAQRITNTGKDDLVFFAVCTPRFTPDCYVTLE